MYLQTECHNWFVVALMTSCRALIVVVSWIIGWLMLFDAKDILFCDWISLLLHLLLVVGIFATSIFLLDLDEVVHHDCLSAEANVTFNFMLMN